MSALEDYSIFDSSIDDEDDGAEADINNLDTTIQVSSIPTTRIHKDHPLEQEELKKDEMGIVIRNKARLVAQGYTQEEGIDYDEVFAPVARIEAIRLFLAYDSFKDFVVYQMDVKSDLHIGKMKKRTRSKPPELGYEPIQTYLFGQWVFKEGKLTRPLFIKSKKFDAREISESFMGELTFFIGITKVKIASTPMETQKPLLRDKDGEEVDIHMYRSMIGSLMYLTSSRPDIMFVVYSPFDLVAYTNSDYVGASLDRKSTTRGYQFLGCKLISWQCKKQIVVGNSTTEAEYVATSRKSKKSIRLMMEKLFGMELELILLHALVDGKKIIIIESSVRRDLQLEDAEGIDCLPNSTIFEELTRMGYEKISQKLTFYKAFFSPQWKFLIHTNLQCLSSKTTAWNEFSSTMASVPQPSGPTNIVANKVVHKELGDSLVRAATTASSLEVEQDSGNITKTRSKATPNESSSLGTNSGGSPKCQETMGDTIAQTRFENVSKHSNDSLLARGYFGLTLATLKSVKVKWYVIEEPSVPVSAANALIKVSAATTTATIPNPRKGIVITELGTPTITRSSQQPS
ncbi:retrovirus-related pol polyprotein from transposon TNT 1-94 [Tanacetum coccineum]